MGVSLGGIGCLNADVLLRECVSTGQSTAWSQVAHSYETALGPAPGDTWLAMSLSALRRLDATLAFAGTYDLTFTSDNLNGPTAAPVVIRSLIVTGAEAISPGARGDDAPYLVRLADRRLTDNRRLVDVGYNLRDVRTGALIASSLHAGVAAWTWAQAHADLWAAAGLGAVPSLPSLDGMPEGTPEGLEFWQVPALDAVADFLGRLGCALAYDPNACTYGVVEVGAADAVHDAWLARWQRWRIDDAYSLVPAGAQRPAVCRVLFPRLPHLTGNGTPWYPVDAADPLGLGRSGTYATLTDDLAALVPSGSPPTNLAALTARAAARAADFFGALSAADRLRTAYPLPLPDVQPGPRVASVRWSSMAGGGGMRTEVRHASLAARTRRAPLTAPPSAILVTDYLGGIDFGLADTLRFDGSSGLDVLPFLIPGVATVTLLAADNVGQNGGVNNNTQYFAGNKIFTFGGEAYGIWIVHPSALDLDNGLAIASAAFPSTFGLAAPGANRVGSIILGTSGLNSGAGGGLAFDYSLALDRFRLAIASSSTGTAVFSVRTFGGLYLDGVYGTSGGGDTVTGGIITALGSGPMAVAWASITGIPAHVSDLAAGTIDSVTIGATAPAAGAFTTLTATAPILPASGGTGLTSLTGSGPPAPADGDVGSVYFDVTDPDNPLFYWRT